MSKRMAMVIVGVCGLLAVLPMVLAGPEKPPPPGVRKAELAKPKLLAEAGESRLRRKQLPADAGNVDQQGWYLGEKGVNVAGAWAVTKGRGVKVAILSSGVDGEHPDLKGQILEAKDFSNSPSGAKDVLGGGTHRTGIVAMKENKGGFVGVAPECQILSGKVLGDDGTGDFDQLIQGIRWAAEQGADVILLDAGAADGATPPDQFQPNVRAAIKMAVEKGIIVIAAAGNDGDRMPYPSITYPGRYPEVITVGASDFSQHVASFSGRGPELDVVAPGDNIVSTLPNSQYTEWDGTGSAGPVVTGVAALYVAAKKSKNEKPSAADFRKLIETTSFSKAETRPNPNSGWGLIQADKIVSAVVDGPIGKTAELSPADFTEAGWAKVKALAPGATGIGLEAGGATGLRATVKK